MSEQCKACAHVERNMLDKALQGGVSIAICSERFGLTADALSRHRANHISEVQFKGGVDPAELLRTLQLNLERAQLSAITCEGTKQQIDALREVRQTTEAIAKLVGAYRAVDPRQLLPFWNRLKATLLEALKPFPEAREAVLVAIEKLMAEGGE